MRSEQNESKIYEPFSESLRFQLKLDKSIWKEFSNKDTNDEPLIKGQLLKMRKSDKSVYMSSFMLSKKGNFYKSSTLNEYYKYISLLEHFVVMEVKTEDQNLPSFTFNINGQELRFFDYSLFGLTRWIDALVQFCICKNYISHIYDFQTQIGKGNFSKVYLVQDIKTQQKFAAKTFLKEDLLKTKKLKDSILSEIFILRQMNHENIIQLKSVHEDSNSLYLLYPIFPEGDLFDYFKDMKQSKRKFTEDQVGLIMSQIFKGLRYLHSKEVIHRDLKLENIILVQKNQLEVVIGDFGLATKFNCKGLFKKCGTPGYIAPEILNLGVYSEKIDIFSAGVICYILLIQKPVFKGNNISTILYENTSGRINFESSQFLSLSKDVQIFLKKTLSLHEDQRPSAEECLKFEFIDKHLKTETIQPSPIRQNNQSVKFYNYQKCKKKFVPSSFISASILPKTIDLKQAKKRSMRQYILLKQALNTQQQAQKISEIDNLYKIDDQDYQMKNGVSVDNDGNSNEIIDTVDNKLFVSESVSSLNYSFYSENFTNSSNSSKYLKDNQENQDDNDHSSFFEELEEEKQSVHEKLTSLSQLVIKKKQSVEQFTSSRRVPL